jgi:hypothetical protein
MWEHWPLQELQTPLLEERKRKRIILFDGGDKPG